MPNPDPVTVVGGGLSGLLTAIYLSRLGYRVEVFERRADPRDEASAEGRSINLLLSARGQDALARVDLAEPVKQRLCVPIRGRMVHALSGTRTPVPYGTGVDELIHVCAHADLSGLLIDEAERLSAVSLHFHQQCVSVDVDSGAATFIDLETRRRYEVKSDFLIGADGTFSVVREALLRRSPVDHTQSIHPWRYKELTLRPDDGARLEPHMSHAWPRGTHMIFALPNRDGSFNATLLLPLTGKPSVESLRTDDEVRTFFNRYYSDVAELLPDLLTEFRRRKAASFPTIRTARWHHRDRVVLIGDACHAVVPFYGQGMNAAFEDVSVLSECLSRRGRDQETAFAEYFTSRKPNTDALADLSTAHFDELVDPVRQPVREARRRVSVALNRLAGHAVVPLYEMIAHTTVPYAECVRSSRRQERRARRLGLDLIIAGYMILLSVWRTVRRLRPGREGAGQSVTGSDVVVTESRSMTSRR